MAASGVTPSDIDTGFDRPLTPAETARIERWVRDVEELIDLRVAAPIDNPAALAAVVRLAVQERWDKRDAGATTSTTVTVDDATVTKRYSEEKISRSGLPWWFNPDWLDWLAPAASPGAFSTRPGFEPDRACLPGWWLP